MGDEDSHSAEFLWRWYIATPSSEEAHVTAWSDHLQKITFNGITKGWGKPFPMERCTGCKSTNHPASDCPFPRDFPELDTTNPAQANPPPRPGVKPAEEEAEAEDEGTGVEETSSGSLQPTRRPPPFRYTQLQTGVSLMSI